MKHFLFQIGLILFTFSLNVTAEYSSADKSSDSVHRKIFNAIENGDIETYKSLTKGLSLDELNTVHVFGYKTFIHTAVRSVVYIQPDERNIPFIGEGKEYEEKYNRYIKWLSDLEKKKQIVAHLIERGVDVNIEGEKGVTPLMLAAQRGNPETADMLIAAGADIHARDIGGNTVLIHATKHKSLSMVKYFLDKGVDHTVLGGKINPNRRISKSEYQIYYKIWVLDQVLNIYRNLDKNQYVNSDRWTRQMAKDLLIEMIESFPPDYVIDLDDVDISFGYQKIFFRLEMGSDPEKVDSEIKEALAKVKVTFKKHGNWFHMLDGFVAKGTFENLTLPDKAKEHILDWYKEKPGDKQIIKRPDGTIRVIM